MYNSSLQASGVGRQQPASQAITARLHFDRGFPTRPREFYDRLEIREWLTCLDWLYQESLDRLAVLKPWQIEAREREWSIQALLDGEIRDAEQIQAGLCLPPKGAIQ